MKVAARDSAECFAEQVEVRTCGKVILSGEHAVVFGQPAIACPIETGVRTIVRVAKDGRWRVVIPAWNRFRGRSGEDLLLRGLHGMLKEMRLPVPLHVEIHPRLPGASGFGISAAVAVSVVEACSRMFGITLEIDQVRALSFQSECSVHGSASGVDNAVIACGVPIVFHEGIVERLRIKGRLHLVIVHSGFAASTASAIERVADRRERSPVSTEHLFQQIGELTRMARGAIESGQGQALGRILTDNHALLAELGVTHPVSDALVLEMLERGALGAKMSGGGCGGVVVGLAETIERGKRLCKYFRLKGYRSFMRSVYSPSPPSGIKE